MTVDGDLDDDGAPDVTITGDILGDDATTTDPLGNTITDALKNDNSSDNVRVFDVRSGGFATVGGLVITGGYSGHSHGGGVRVAEGATLALRNSCVSGNSADWGGGGINNEGTATLSNTTVSGNDGGGIENDGTATLTNTTVSGNEGRGIDNARKGTAALTNTTVSGNSAGGDGAGFTMREPRR